MGDERRVRERYPDRTSEISKPGRPACSVFLCHNSADKPLVKEIADRLELDFGVPHFLDAFAIPSGEAFKPWIERALATSTGCAIFLGAAGWGPTHIWEAEQAIARQQSDPSFRLIPVALPGLRDEDMLLLDEGRTFRDLNWADLRNGITSQDGLDQLYAAVTGQAPAEGRGPANLTPYQIRRDAARWKRSNPSDTSILYRGSQLTEAERLTHAMPDLVTVEEVAPFLLASASRQRAVWRRIATAALVGIVVVVGLAVWADRMRRLAENRRTLAVSRELALEAKAERSPVLSQLLAAQAYATAPTPDAAATLLERLQMWPLLGQTFHSDVGGLTRVAWDKNHDSIVAGSTSGSLLKWFTNQAIASMPVPRASQGQVRSIAVDMAGDIWTGYEDGRVLVWTSTGHRTQVTGIPPGIDLRHIAEVNSLQLGPRIDAIALSPNGERAAIGTGDGTGDGQVFLVDPRTKRVLAGPIHVGVPRVNALDFDRRSELLLVGTGFGSLVLIDRNGRIVKRLEHPEASEILAVRFTDAGILIAVDDVGRAGVWKALGGSFTFVRAFRTVDFLTAAAIRGDGGMIALGDGHGKLHVVDVSARTIITSLQAHVGDVRGVAWDATGDRLVTVGSDGVAALWNLRQVSPVILDEGRLPIGVHAIRVMFDGSLLASCSSVGAATIWKKTNQTWTMHRDLLELTHAALGGVRFRLPAADPSSPYVPVPTPEIELTHIDAKGERVVWATRDGAVLWTPLSARTSATVLWDGATRGGGSVQALAFSDDGRFVAVAYSDPSVLLIDVAQPGILNTSRRIALTSAARSLAFTRNGNLLATGLESGGIALWSVAEGTAVTPVVNVHGNAAGNVTFARDDTVLVSHAVVGDGTETAITVETVPSLTPARTLVARPSGVPPAIIAAGRHFLAGVNSDGMVDLWDSDQYRPLGSVKVSMLPLTAAVFSADERRLIVADEEGWVRSVIVGGPAWLTLACKLANRPMTRTEWRQYLAGDDYQPACGVSKANGVFRSSLAQ